MLETIAGIVDARETPDAGARREANLALTHLEPAGSYYASSGASTGYFYHFVGTCDLPQLTSYLGGLHREGEDLRLHPMTLDAAMALSDSGEVATGPAFYLLYWLLRNRDRLRALA